MLDTTSEDARIPGSGASEQTDAADLQKSLSLILPQSNGGTFNLALLAYALATAQSTENPSQIATGETALMAADLATAETAQQQIGSDAVQLNVQNIAQLPELPNGCEITSATIVLNYLGYDVDKMTMSKDYLPKQHPYWSVDPNVAFMGDPSGKSSYYCNQNPIVEAVNRYLDDMNDIIYRATDVSGSSLEDLFVYIEQGYPVIVWGTVNFTELDYSTAFLLPDGSYPLSNSHCLVLTGYDSENCYFADPLCQITSASHKNFDYVFHARGARAVAILPQDFEQKAD